MADLTDDSHLQALALNVTLQLIKLDGVLHKQWIENEALLYYLLQVDKIKPSMHILQVSKNSIQCLPKLIIFFIC